MKPAKQNGCNASRLAVVLAGGLSRRFGTDKVYAKVGEKFMIQMIVEKLKKAGFEVVLSVAKPKWIPLKTIPTIEDPFPFEGPLQALYGALVQLKSERLLLVPCDMPLMKPRLLKLLWEESRDADVTVLKWKGKLYPLPGVYSKNIIPTAKTLLNQGIRDLKSLLGLPQAEVKIIPADSKSLLNVNTKQALKEASHSVSPA